MYRGARARQESSEQSSVSFGASTAVRLRGNRRPWLAMEASLGQPWATDGLQAFDKLNFRCLDFFCFLFFPIFMFFYKFRPFPADQVHLDGLRVSEKVASHCWPWPLVHSPPWPWPLAIARRGRLHGRREDMKPKAQKNAMAGLVGHGWSCPAFGQP